MKTVLTFDCYYVDRVRRALTQDGWKEGTDYRIGMAEKRYSLTIRVKDGVKASYFKHACETSGVPWSLDEAERAE